MIVRVAVLLHLLGYVLPGQMRLVRTYGEGDSTLLDLSTDGSRVLVSSVIKIPCKDGTKGNCYENRVAVYRTSTGERIAMLPKQDQSSGPVAGTFVTNELVGIARSGRDFKGVWQEWDLSTGSIRDVAQAGADFSAFCFARPDVLVAIRQAKPSVTLLIREGNAIRQRTPTQPDWVDVPLLRRTCNEWRASGDSLYVSGAEGTGNVRPIKLFPLKPIVPIASAWLQTRRVTHMRFRRMVAWPPL